MNIVDPQLRLSMSGRSGSFRDLGCQTNRSLVFRGFEFESEFGIIIGAIASIRLIGDTSRLRRCGLVNDDEISRMLFYRRTDDQERFILGRALARTLLESSSGLSASCIRFVPSSLGKPQSEPSCGQFNISHSAELVIVVASPIVQLGVDIEWREARPPFEISRSFMHAQELRQMGACIDEDSRRTYFYNVFTRKEAVLKAIGAGFSIDPSSVFVGGSGERLERLFDLADLVEVRTLALTGAYACHIAAIR